MLAPLAGSLQGADARGALAAATAALARLLPALACPARLLAALNSVSASSVRAALPALSRAVQCLSVVSLVCRNRVCGCGSRALALQPALRACAPAWCRRPCGHRQGSARNGLAACKGSQVTASSVNADTALLLLDVSHDEPMVHDPARLQCRGRSTRAPAGSRTGGAATLRGPWCGPVSDPARARQVDEPDYDARLGAYAELVPGAWADLGARRAPPLLHAALADLRRPEDLALRHAASQARRGAPPQR